MVTFLSKVVNAFERIAPLRLAQTSWDNVGVLVQAPYPNEKATKVFLTIDLTPQVLEEVFQHEGIGVIAAYHPIWFKAWKRMTIPTETTTDPEVIKQGILLKLIAKGISVYCPHTALDSVYGGLNDWLASGLVTLDIRTIEPIIPTLESTQSAPEGQGRLVTLAKARPMMEVIQLIKSHLGLQHVRVSQTINNTLISTIGICAGSGASMLNQTSTTTKNPDLFWTGEMSHHEILAASVTGTVCVLCEHTNTERKYLTKVLHSRLVDELVCSDSDVIVSQLDCDPIRIV